MKKFYAFTTLGMIIPIISYLSMYKFTKIVSLFGLLLSGILLMYALKGYAENRGRSSLLWGGLAFFLWIPGFIVGISILTCLHNLNIEKNTNEIASPDG